MGVTFGKATAQLSLWWRGSGRASVCPAAALRLRGSPSPEVRFWRRGRKDCARLRLADCRCIVFALRLTCYNAADKRFTSGKDPFENYARSDTFPKRARPRQRPYPRLPHRVRLGHYVRVDKGAAHRRHPDRDSLFALHAGLSRAVRHPPPRDPLHGRARRGAVRAGGCNGRDVVLLYGEHRAHHDERLERRRDRRHRTPVHRAHRYVRHA